jgi:hypothetical protein
LSTVTTAGSIYVCQEETHRVRNASGKLAKRTRWVERCQARYCPETDAESARGEPYSGLSGALSGTGNLVELKVPVAGRGLVSRAVFGRLERPVLFGSERCYFDAGGELVECDLYQRNEGGKKP